MKMAGKLPGHFCMMRFLSGRPGAGRDPYSLSHRLKDDAGATFSPSPRRSVVMGPGLRRDDIEWYRGHPSLRFNCQTTRTFRCAPSPLVLWRLARGACPVRANKNRSPPSKKRARGTPDARLRPQPRVHGLSLDTRASVTTKAPDHPAFRTRWFLRLASCSPRRTVETCHRRD